MKWGQGNPSPDPTPGIATPNVSDITSSTAKVSSSLTDTAYATEVQFFYSATNGSDTGSVVAAVIGNEATANLSDLLPATTYTVLRRRNGDQRLHAAEFFDNLYHRRSTDESCRLVRASGPRQPTRRSRRRFIPPPDRSATTRCTTTIDLHGLLGSLSARKRTHGKRTFRQMAAQSRTGRTEQINVWSSSYGVNLGATTSDGYDSSKEFYARGHQIPNADRNGSDELVCRPITQPIPRRRFRTNSTAVFGSSSKVASEISLRLRTRLYVVTGAILRTAGNHEAITWIKPASRTAKTVPYRTTITKRC